MIPFMGRRFAGAGVRGVSLLRVTGCREDGLPTTDGLPSIAESRCSEGSIGSSSPTSGPTRAVAGTEGSCQQRKLLVTDPIAVARVDHRAIDSLILATAASIFICRPFFPYSAVARAGLPETPLPSKPPLSASLSLRMY